MRQNSGLLTQHVSSIIMPIFRSTLVSTALWFPNLENMKSEVCSTSVVCMLLWLDGEVWMVITNVLLKMGIIMLETC
jgi:hypothetical protein